MEARGRGVFASKTRGFRGKLTIQQASIPFIGSYLRGVFSVERIRTASKAVLTVDEPDLFLGGQIQKDDFF